MRNMMTAAGGELWAAPAYLRPDLPRCLSCSRRRPAGSAGRRLFRPRRY